MRIENPTPLRPATGKRGVSGSNGGGAGFGSVLDSLAAGESGAAHGPSDVAAMSAMGNLWAMQEVSEEQHKRQKQLKRGKATLDSLDKLRIALLTGRLPEGVVAEIEQFVREEREAGGVEPGLSDILDEIELRAAVEMAKLEGLRMTRLALTANRPIS